MNKYNKREYPMKTTSLKSIIFSTATLIASLTTNADTFEWSVGTGYYGTAANWTNTTGLDAAPPNKYDTALFNGGSTYNVYMTTGTVALGSINATNSVNATLRTTSPVMQNINITTGDQDLLVNSDLTFGYATSNSRPFNINVGTAASTAGTLLVGSSNDGKLSIVGKDTLFNMFGTAVRFIGRNGKSGTFEISNNATANIEGNLAVGLSSNNTTTGNINVNSGGKLNTQDFSIGTYSSNATGTVNITGANSEVSMAPNSTLTIGAFTGANSSLTINTLGTFNTGTVSNHISQTGLVNIGSTGTLNLNANTTIDGGTLTNAGTLNLAANKNLTASNGATVDFNTQFVNIKDNQTYQFTDSNLNAKFNAIGNGSTGTLNLANAQFNGQINNIGFSGGTGTVNFSDYTNANISNTLNIGVSGFNNSQGIVNNTDGLVIVDANTNISTSDSSTATGIYNGHGQSILHITGDTNTLNIGSATQGTGNLTLNDTSRIISSQAGININRTGTLLLSDNSNISANGDLNIDGGTLTSDSGSAYINLDSGKNITLSNGATFSQLMGTQSIKTDSRLTVQSGSSANLSTLKIGTNAPDRSVSHPRGILDVTGINTTLDVTGTVSVGGDGTRGYANFGDQSISTINTLHLTYRNSDYTHGGGGIHINSGAKVNVTTLSLGSNNNEAGAEIFISDNNSHLDAGTGTTTIGSQTAANPAYVLIKTNGTFTTGQDGLILNHNAQISVGNISIFGLNSSGTLNITGQITDNGGKINHRRGTINFTDTYGTFVIGHGQYFGNEINLDTGTYMNVADTTLIESTGTLYTSKFTSKKLINNGKIIVNNSFQTLGDLNTFGAYTGTGILEVGGNSLTINSASYALLGSYTSFTNKITAQNGIALAVGSVVQASGTLLAKTSAAHGSLIDLTGNLTVGDENAYDGFFSDGQINIGQHRLILKDKNQAVLGSLTNIGSSGIDGILQADNGIILEYGKNITGQGVINSDNSITQAFINNGHIQGNSPANAITLTGYVKGVGTADNVIYAGTYAPGLSPAKVYAGKMAFAESATLEIELGGTRQGTQYDNITSTEEITLDGTLDILLLNDYEALFQDHFEIINAASITGAFDQINLPELDDELAWQITTTATSIIVDVISHLQGDTNGDGTVDITDINNITANFGGNPEGDADYDGDTDLADLFTARNNFGRSLPTSGPVSIPEPTSIFTILTMATSALIRRIK